MAMNNPTEPLLSGSSDHNDETASQSSFPDVMSPGMMGGSRPREGQTSSRAWLRRSLKRKGLGVPRARRLTWLCMDIEGEKTIIHADKRAIIGKLGLSIPIRDMRLLDHNLLQSDSVILVREGAIIASLEHVRIIIMHDKVIIPREGVENNPLTSRFVDILDESIQEWLEQKAHFEEQMLLQSSESPDRYTDHQQHDETSSMSDLPQNLEPLPFELVVLEAALKEVIGSISVQATDIERVIMPAMDALVKSVNPNNLECVRKVKTRLQRITVRCEAVRDELQRFLQDDDDMDRMCLTRKKEIEGEHLTKHQSNDDLMHSESHRHAMQVNGNSRSISMSTSFSHRRGFMMRQATTSPATMAQPTGGISSSLQQEEDIEADIEAHLEVENLLESYFMQVDSMYDKLDTLGEYIKDTEEYINIELDSSRNRLIRFDIVLSVATFALMPFNMVSGMLGENLIMPEAITGSVKQFIGVNAASAVVCLLAFYAIMMYMRLYKLM